MTLVGGRFEFDRAGTVALAGADFGTTLAGRALPSFATFEVRAGDVLQCTATRGGARCYLCVQGGIRLDTIFGSASTHLTSGVGGLDGRALRAGDRLRWEPIVSTPLAPRRVRDAVQRDWAGRELLRVTPGPQHEEFTVAARERWLRTPYRVTEQSDRMGLRLDGPPIERHSTHDMLSEGVALGAIQVPPDGRPIVSFVEHQTTGGYPKIANVIAADLHRVGQLRPRDVVQFESVEPEHAVALLAAQEEAWFSPRSLEPA
jgi:antagonist of KipI